jgi:phosphoglycerate dehydrogenase-like enzyme
VREVTFLVEFIQEDIGIMGLGTIGSFVQKGEGMGMRVITWDMVHREIPLVDHQYKAEQMKEFLGEADYVLLTLPATPQTTNLIDQSVFKAMKKTAYLINICRGAVVDEPALVEALKEKGIAGAILDVVKEEPLPPQSELWDCPNLILSPHISGPSLPEDIVEVFKENFRRYVNLEPLLGQIHFERGELISTKENAGKELPPIPEDCYAITCFSMVVIFYPGSKGVRPLVSCNDEGGATTMAIPCHGSSS